jgi:predicted RNase H-like HicB family nuclease
MRSKKTQNKFVNNVKISNLEVANILKEPYMRILLQDKEDETFTAEIVEFPGCVAQGRTPQEAYNNLEAVAKSWIEVAVDLGQEIPKPLYTSGFGGRVALRLPRTLHRQAVLAAEREGISLNQFIVTSISEKIGATNLYEKLTQRFCSQAITDSTNIFHSIWQASYLSKADTSKESPNILLINEKEKNQYATN